MPVPKFRTSASKRNMRRSHHALKAPALSVCSNCGDVHKPHTVCKACGHYKSGQVMETKVANTAWDGSGADFKTEE